MAGLRNKQVSGAKSAIGMFLVESGTSTHCVNTIAKMGFSSTYQTAFNRLDKIENVHQSGIQTYIQNFVRLFICKTIILIYFEINKIKLKILVR
jgi:hypothetical protein